MAYNKLTWTLTNYGLQRIALAISDNNVNLYLQKIKIGDSNLTYYVPSPTQTTLKNLKGSFNVHSTELDSVNNSVTFMTTIPEVSDGYDILEAGLYEVIDNVDYLFAVGCGEPIRKPLVSDNYSVSVNYNIKLFNVNLATVYSQILLDPLSQYVTDEGLANLELDLLEVENNLSVPISNSTEIIGQNKPEILRLLLEKEKNSLNNYFTYSIMSNISNFMSNTDNIKALWFFRHIQNTNSGQITDFSKNGINLTLNKKPVLFNSNDVEFSTFIDIDDTNYFSLGDDVTFNLSNLTTVTPFSILVFLEHNEVSSINTILAKSNYYTDKHSFEITKNIDNGIDITLFTDSSNYIKFSTPNDTVNNTSPYVLGITCDGSLSSPSIKVFINGSQRNVSSIETGTYAGMSVEPLPLTSYIINSSNEKSQLINSKISNICALGEELNEMFIKLISLEILASSGINICLTA